MAVLDAARNLVGIADATSSEFEGEGFKAVGRMIEWVRGNELEQRAANDDLGGTMRLGTYPAVLTAGSLAADIYQNVRIMERHRHRYEVNVDLKDRLAEKGFVFSGLSPDGALPEIGEVTGHPWFIGVQFHPELTSRPFAPHPLFVGFVAASMVAKTGV